MALKVCRRRRTQKLQNDPRDAALEDLPLHLEPSWVQLASPKVLFRGCKSAIRYAKVLFRGCKSAIRYALLEHRLPPLWAHMDFEEQKCNTYAKKKVTLQPLWAHMDFEGATATKRSAVQMDSCIFACFIEIVMFTSSRFVRHLCFRTVKLNYIIHSRNSLVWLPLASHGLAQRGLGLGTYLPIAPES